MNMLMSIKPRYVEKIISGEKLFEFRKHLFKPVDRIYIYETRPVKRVIGFMTYDKVLADTPLNIWQRCWKKAGMGIVDYESYYHNSKQAIAISISDIHLFERPISIDEFDQGKVPQSFRYTSTEI